jgi:hypothetical protein
LDIKRTANDATVILYVRKMQRIVKNNKEKLGAATFVVSEGQLLLKLLNVNSFNRNLRNPTYFI